MTNTSSDDVTSRARRLLAEPWRRVAVQGGVIERWDQRTRSYLLSGLWVRLNECWIEINGIRGEDDSYFLSLRLLDAPPIPEQDKFFSPPRLIVRDFPAALPLQELREASPTKVVFVGPCSAGEDAFAVVGRVEVSSIEGTVFTIDVSESILGDLMVSASNI